MFEANFREQRIKLLPKRQRKVGGGRKRALSTAADKLFTALLYLKCYPTFDVLGFMIGLEKTRACRNIHLFMPVLEKTLGRQLILPKRQNRLYSGKRKTTTRKNIVVANEKKEVLYLTSTKSGRRHDKRLLDKSGIENLPAYVTAWADTGFIGLARIHPNTQIPKKHTKKRPLTYGEKEDNRIISSFRAAVEHAICGIKRLKVTTDVYRIRKINFDDTLMLLSTGIWNYHLRFTSVPVTS